MKALVTGGAGFIGSHLSKRLLEMGHEVTIIDDLSTGSIANVPQGSRFVNGSILDSNLLGSAMEGIEIVFHLAAISSVALCNTQPDLALKVNEYGTQHVLQQAVGNGVRMFVMASSSSVYGDHGEIYLAEEMDADPKSVYAQSKFFDECYCLVYAGKTHIKLLIPRLFNVVGDGQTLDGDWIIPNFFDCISRGESLKVYGTGEDKRDYIFVNDVVDAILFLVFHSCEGIYNVGTGAARSVNDIIDAFQTIYGPLRVEHIVARQGDLPYSCADISKLVQAGFEPEQNFLDGLKRIAERKGLHAQPNQKTIDGDCAVKG